MSASEAPKPRRIQLWPLALGVALFAGVFAANDLPGVMRTLAEARFKALAVIAAHLAVIAAAGLGWRVLLTRSEAPGLVETFRLRWVKEAVNGLLPVAQVGGDVVRARLAARPGLPLATSAASCAVDVGLSLVCLIGFVLAGLAAASSTLSDPRLSMIALALAGAGGLLTVGLLAAERFGLLKLVDQLAVRAGGALRELQGFGDEVRRISRDARRVAWSMAWHLAAWMAGVVETGVALWALGLPNGWRDAFVLESLAQGARALGFALPGSLGVQEGGYLLICSGLGLSAESALALSLLRRLRELALGLAGLVLWRFTPRQLDQDPE